ncbi:T-cell receptor beta-2 chain C region%2C partial [Scomber scombrus]
MIQLHLIIYIIIIWIKGASSNQSKDVHQTPTDLLWERNDKVKLTCKHQINNYDTILWYHSSQGNTSLNLVGYTSYIRTQVVDEAYKGRFNVSGDGVFPIKEMQVLQSPAELLIPLSKEDKLTCTHKIPNGNIALKMIGNIYFGGSTVEPSFEGFFNMSGDGRNTAYLHILNPKPEHSAKYSCAQFMTMSSSVYAFSILFIWFLSQVNSNAIQQSRPQIVEKNTTVTISCSHDQAESVTFHQSGPGIVNVKDKVEIECSQDDDSLYVMLWYQQRENGQMALMGYNYDVNPADYEKKFKDRIEIERPSRLNGTLIIKSVDHSDSAVYFCAASFSYGVKIDQSPFALSQKDTSVTLQCKQDNAEYMYMYWEGSQCGSGTEAYFGDGTKLTVLDTNITVTPPTVKVLQPSKKQECLIRKGEKKQQKTLLCVATGFYPDHVSVSWRIDEDIVTHGVATGNAVQNGTYYSITSTLTVPIREWLTRGKLFNCTVSFFNVTNTVYRSDWVQSDGDGPRREKYVKVTQAAKLTYIILIVKSSIYGVFVVFLLRWLQRSPGKQNN